MKAILSLCLAFTLMSFTLNHEAHGTKFSEETWNSLGKKARNEEKPIFVFVGAQYCYISQKMERSFQKKAIGKYLNERFICKKVKADNILGNLRASNWGVSTVPSYVFMDSKRNVIYKASGMKTEEAFIAEAEKALEIIQQSEQTNDE